METPLHLAMKFGQVNAVRYLVLLGPRCATVCSTLRESEQSALSVRRNAHCPVCAALCVDQIDSRAQGEPGHTPCRGGCTNWHVCSDHCDVSPCALYAEDQA
jgi:hypothetical protein